MQMGIVCLGFALVSLSWVVEGALIPSIPKDGVGPIMISIDTSDKDGLLNKNRLMVRFDLGCLSENESFQQVRYCIRNDMYTRQHSATVFYDSMRRSKTTCTVYNVVFCLVLSYSRDFKLLINLL